MLPNEPLVRPISLGRKSLKKKWPFKKAALGKLIKPPARNQDLVRKTASTTTHDVRVSNAMTEGRGGGPEVCFCTSE